MGKERPLIAIDTNVIVRFLVRDDATQAARARAMIEEADVFVPTTVLLETEWVLRSVYEIPAPRAVSALRAFLDLPQVIAQDESAARAALDWADGGMDFADALHLASASQCSAFASFDRAMARNAAKTDAPRVREP